MPKNNLAELNDNMFEQLRRLNNPKLTKEQMMDEIERAKGVCLLASQIIANSNLALKAHVIQQGGHVPQMLTIEDNNDGEI